MLKKMVIYYSYEGNTRFMAQTIAGAVGADLMELKLKKLETKRLKLNMAIQSTNFASTIDFDGEQISITEALEIRKKLQAEFDNKSKSVTDSAYKQITHKEKRDIEHQPKDSFCETYEDFQNSLIQLRQLTNKIHLANHASVTNFKDE